MSFVTIGAFFTTYAGAIAAASAAVGVVGAAASADAARKSAHTNADIQRQQGQMAVQQASANEDSQRRRGAIAIGRQASNDAAGSGLSGTNADNLQQSATDVEMDALNIRYGGKIGQLSGNNNANLSDMQANDAMRAGYLNAGAAALSSAGSYAAGQNRIRFPINNGG